MTFAIIVALIVYIAMIFSIKYRTAITSIGLGVILIYGTVTNTFTLSDVLSNFPIEIITLILALGLFSKTFENNSFFKYIGDKFLSISKGKKTLIYILLPLVMYFTSLFMNNLSVVLLFTFICLELSIKLELSPLPILVSGLIASNIGGCPLPWADTPAVILTLYSGFSLMDFLTKLFIPCALLAGLLIPYTLWWVKKYDKKNDIMNISDDAYLKNKFTDPPPPHHPNHIPPPTPPILHDRHINASKFKKIYCPIILFISFIIAICIAPFYSISISFISIIYIGLLLLITIDKPDNILNTVPVLDSLVFISTLFILSSVLEKSGVLDSIVKYIISFTSDNVFLILLAVLFSAFIIATFLSAGPAAATLLPICLQLNPIVGSNLVYAALALGILAGSSMLPWSATGGPIMLSEVGRYQNDHIIESNYKVKINQVCDLKKYTSLSIPFSLIILSISALFLISYVFIF